MKTYNILTIEEFKKNIDNNSRLLGIDPGKKNIGIAICDEKKVVATPLKVIKKNKFQFLLKEIQDIIKENDIKSKNLYLGGHSQGGIMAYKIALGNPALFEGFIASSARLPVKYSIKDELTEYQNIKALIIHGKNDNVLDVKFARAGKNLLDKLGIQTQYLVKDNGHSLVPDFAMLIQNWIEDI